MSLLNNNPFQYLTPTSYSDFQLWNRSHYAGHWTVTDSPYCSIIPSYYDCCGWVLGCERVYNPSNPSPTDFSFTTVVTLDKSVFQSASSMTFVWSFWPLFAGNTTAPSGTSFNFKIVTEIGDFQFEDAPAVVAVSPFDWTHDFWDPATKKSHTFSIPATFAGSLLYAPITIRLSRTYPNPPNYEHAYFFVRGVSFKTLADSTAQPTPSPSGPDSSPTSVSVGVIAGATVGGVAFIALALAAAFLVYRRRRRHHSLASEKALDQPPYSIPSSPRERQDPVQEGHPVTVSVGAHPGPVVVPPPTIAPPKATPNTQSPLEKESQRPLPPPGSTSTDRNTHPTLNASSTAAGIPHEPPPVYGNSTVLATWASANRNAISEDMEAKLSAAGYMPGDNPDIFSEDEWETKYGLTRLELFRLQNLYARASNV